MRKIGLFILLSVTLAACNSSSSGPSNATPVITSLSSSALTLAWGNTSVLTCLATDADNDQLIYNWSASVNNTFNGSGSVVSWTAPNYDTTVLITCTVDDEHGGIATQSISLAVTMGNNHAPVITELLSGYLHVPQSTSTPLVCYATDEDGNSLTYSWSAATGAFLGQGSQVYWIAPANETETTIYCSVNDGYTHTVTDSITVTVVGAITPAFAISPLSSNATVNEETVLTFSVADMLELLGTSLEINYDETVVEFVDSSFEYGTVIGNAPLFNLKKETGKVNITLSRYNTNGEEGFSGSGTLFSFAFRSIAGGDSDIQIQNLNLINPRGYPIPGFASVSIQNAHIHVE